MLSTIIKRRRRCPISSLVLSSSSNLKKSDNRCVVAAANQRVAFASTDALFARRRRQQQERREITDCINHNRFRRITKRTQSTMPQKSVQDNNTDFDFSTQQQQQQQHQQQASVLSERSHRTLKQQEEDHNYCVDLVKNRDREGYLCGLLVPAAARKSYFAIRAFNVELASVKDSGRNNNGGGRHSVGNDADGTIMMLQLRMKWWRNALDQIYMHNSGEDDNHHHHNNNNNNEQQQLLLQLSTSCWSHPVVCALDRAVREKQLTKRFLERLIDAREHDLLCTDRVPFRTMKDAVQYSEDTVSSLLYLSLECTGVREDKADLVASHAGIGIGLTNALRSFPFLLRNSGEIVIPQELFFLRNNTTTSSNDSFPYDNLPFYMQQREEELYQTEEQQQPLVLNTEQQQILLDATEHMAGVALMNLEHAQENQSHVPKKAKSVLLPCVPALHYLQKLQKEGRYDLFSPPMLSQQNKSDGNSNRKQAFYQLQLLAYLARSWITGII